MSEREETLEKVTLALPVFEKINELFFAANSLKQQTLVARTDEERARQNAKRKYKIDWKNFNPVLCIIGFVFLSGITLAIESSVEKMPAFAKLVLELAIIAVCVKLYLNQRARMRKKHEETETQIDEMKSQMEEISKEIYRVTTENQELINLMPRDYRYYDAVAFFENALANGRADSMKEAINLYEEYIHRQNMELNGRQMLEQSRMQSAMLANIEQSSREAAINSGIAATFSILNYLS